MEVVDWTGLSVLAGLIVGAFGYLSRQMHRMEDRLLARLDRIDERFIRHLETHAGH